MTLLNLQDLTDERIICTAFALVMLMNLLNTCRITNILFKHAMNDGFHGPLRRCGG